MTALVRYDAACKALAEARAVDEVKSIRDKAEAMRWYAKQAKNRQLEIDAAEIRIRAERRVGEMMKEQKETVGLNEGATAGGKKESSRGSIVDPRDTRPTLADAGIDKHLADRARKLAALPEEEFEERLSDWRDYHQSEEGPATINLLKGPHVRGTFGTGDNQWFTPPEYLDMARQVLGEIDLDPASSELAQEKVKAKKFYTAETNGLDKPWSGRVWLNPPYAQPLIEQFVLKLVDEWDAGSVKSAIMLTHNYTDTEWFQAAAAACTAICFTKGRVKFYSPSGEIAAPTQGQAFFYFGKSARDADKFAKLFSSIGFVVGICEPSKRGKQAVTGGFAGKR